MADLSDVFNVLAATISGVLYPAGTGQPSAIGAAVKVYAGWPNAAQLDADLRATPAVCHVTVYPQPQERNTTRFVPTWMQVSVNTPTLTLTAAGQAVTVAGTIPPAVNPHNAVVIANGKPYVYPVLTSDTLATVAATLAALIAADIPGTAAAGAVITLPSSARINAARIGLTGSSIREVRRQERAFQIAIWADTPTHRDAAAALIDTVFAATTFIALPDGTAGRLHYRGSAMSDALQKDCLFRRDLFYTVEYGTTQTETETQITQEQTNVSVAVAGVAPYTLVSTNFS